MRSAIKCRCCKRRERDAGERTARRRSFFVCTAGGGGRRGAATTPRPGAPPWQTVKESPTCSSALLFPDTCHTWELIATQQRNANARREGLLVRSHKAQHHENEKAPMLKLGNSCPGHELKQQGATTVERIHVSSGGKALAHTCNSSASTLPFLLRTTVPRGTGTRSAAASRASRKRNCSIFSSLLAEESNVSDRTTRTAYLLEGG